MRYPERYKSIQRAYVLTGINPGTGRKAKLYRCSECYGLFPLSSVEVDHVEPVGRLKDYTDLPLFVEKLFCSNEKLTVLCRSCHQKKTSLERKELRRKK